MYGEVSHEVEVEVSASQAWKLYGTLQLASIIQKGLPHMIQKIDLLEGDGGVGTVLQLTLIGGPGMPERIIGKEKFTTINNEKFIKEVEAVEGGLLELGFNQYRVCFEIIEKGEDSCIIKSKVEYDVNDEAASIASTVPSAQLEAIAGVASDYLLKTKND